LPVRSVTVTRVLLLALHCNAYAGCRFIVRGASVVLAVSIIVQISVGTASKIIDNRDRDLVDS
jgi:hypothetical protein